jgi:integrase
VAERRRAAHRADESGRRWYRRRRRTGYGSAVVHPGRVAALADRSSGTKWLPSPVRDQMRRNGAPRLRRGALFPMLQPNRDVRRSTPASNAVSKWMRNRLKITDKRIGPNHSWRHLFETVHRRLRTRQDIVDAIMGHEGNPGEGGIGRHYSEYEVAVCRARLSARIEFLTRSGPRNSLS